MANEFKIKKGLIVEGASGGTVVDVQGSQGQLFSVTDNLSGSIFAVSDISGVPILDVNSSGISYFDGSVGIGIDNPNSKLHVLDGVAGTYTPYNESDTLVIESDTPGGISLIGTGAGSNSKQSIVFGTTSDVTSASIIYDSNNSVLTIGTTTASNYLKFVSGNGTLALTLDTSQNAIFAGSLFPNVNGGGSLGIGSKQWSALNLTSGAAVLWANGDASIVEGEVGNYSLSFKTYDGTSNSRALLLEGNNDATFSAQAFSSATSSGDASSTLTTKGYVDGLITGATIYRGTWQAGISATSSGATTASTTLTVSAAILDAAGNTPVLVGAVVTGAGITGTVKVATVTSSTVYELDTAIDSTATPYIFSPIYGAPDLSGVTETSGYYYICSEAGSATPNDAGTEPNTWGVGDWVIWNDDVGSGEWQKVDNSSVLSGVGTGQTVALWEGPASVTDSETLGNAPITVSGNNTTFAGTINADLGILASGAMSSFETTLSNNDDWQNSPISILERDNVQGTQTADKYAPNLNFHWGGKFSASLWMAANGHLHYGQYGATGIPASDGTINAATFLGDLNGTINTATTGVTQTAGNNSTLIATTAYADAAAAAVDPSGVYLPLTAGSGSSLTDNLYINDVDQNNVNRYGNFQSEVGFSRSPVTGDPDQWFKVVELNGSPKRIKFSIIATGDNTNSYDNFLISTSGYGMNMHIEKLPGGRYNTSKLLSVAVINPSNGGGVEIWIKLGPVSSGTGATYVACTSDVLASATILASATTTAPTLTSNDTQLDISGDNRNHATIQTSRGATFGAKVGIGTNAPAAMLTVSGDTTITGNTGIGTTDTSRRLSVFGYGTSFAASEIPTTIATVVSNQMTDNNYHSILQLVAVRASLTSGQNSNGYLGFSTIDDSNNQGVRDAGRIAIVNEAGSARNSPTALSFWTNTPGGNFNTTPATEKMRITSAGNVGIGNTNPSDYSADANNLVVGSLSGNNGITILSTSSSGYGSIYFADATTGNKVYSGFIRYQQNQSNMTFGTNEAERMRIDLNGNVGIGITNPSSKLELWEVAPAAPTMLTLHGYALDTVADDTMGAFIDFKRTDNNASFTPQARIGMLIRDSNGDNGIISEGCGNLVFHTSRGTDAAGAGEDVERMRITDIGNVGIGTSTPNAKLDVQGTQGQLFSVTDDLSGEIFAVADISGVPIMTVNSSGLSTFDGNVNLGDDNKLQLGASQDLQIYHDGGNSFINEVGTGALILKSNGSGVYIKTIAGDTQAQFLNDSAVNLYYDNSFKFATTNTGVTVAGNIDLPSNGAILFDNTNNTEQYYIRNGGGSQSSFQIGKGNPGSDIKLVIDDNGNVGIGETNPGSKLTIDAPVGNFANGTNAISINYDGGASGGDVGGGIVFSQKWWSASTGQQVTGGIFGIKNAGNGSYGGGLGFYTQPNGAGSMAQNMVIRSTGEVGIGTYSPDSLLHVSADVTGANKGTITIEGRPTGFLGDDIAAIDFHNNGSKRADIRMERGNTANDSQLVFSTSDTGTLNDALIINEAGNVGIGGNAPSYLLDVRDGTTSGAIARFSAINPHVIIESSTAGPAVLHFKPNTTGNKSGQFKVTAGSGYNFRWSNDAAGASEVSYMTLDTSTTGGGDLTVKGDVIAYGAPSDRKYKENIKPIESALDKAMQLQGVTFDWKDSESILDIKEDIGFIAQDVEKVLPELVRDSGKGNLSLRYQGITPILLEAIKELKAEIEELKKQIK